MKFWKLHWKGGWLGPNVYFSFNLKWIRSKGFSADEKAFMFSLNHSSIVCSRSCFSKYQNHIWFKWRSRIDSLKRNQLDKYIFCCANVANLFLANIMQDFFCKMLFLFVCWWWPACPLWKDHVSAARFLSSHPRNEFHGYLWIFWLLLLFVSTGYY